MKATADWVNEQFDRQLRGLLRETRAGGAEEVRNQGRLWAEQTMRFTPPRSLAQGRAAVKRDINRILVGVEKGFLEFLQKRFGTARDRITLRRQDGTPYTMEWKQLDMGGRLIGAHHLAARGARGRVKRHQFSSSNWIAPGKLVVPERVKARYIKEKQANVGLARSGWGRGRAHDWRQSACLDPAAPPARVWALPRPAQPPAAPSPGWNSPT
jgi:hypothetical protein